MVRGVRLDCMAFRVLRPGLQVIDFSDDDTYEFKPDGVLKVTTKGDRITYYAAGAWEYVSTENGHEPGLKPTPAHGVGERRTARGQPRGWANQGA